VRSVLGAGALAPWATLSVAPAVHDARRGAQPLRDASSCAAACDGLTAAPVPGDPAFAEARGLLGHLRDAERCRWTVTVRAASHCWRRCTRCTASGELAVVHATGLPYRERSHFDAQQVLESGGTRPYELSTGWLARALAARRLAADEGRGAGDGRCRSCCAVPAEVDTWAPSNLPEPAPDLVARLEAMYRRRPGAGAGAGTRARPARRAPGMAANPSGIGGMAAGLGGGGRAAVTLATQGGRVPASWQRRWRCWRWAAGTRTPTRPHRWARPRTTCALLDAAMAAPARGPAAGAPVVTHRGAGGH
jgi:uncharacterized protein (DUF1501 family)